MRIAQVAPLYESVPPQLYGGTERVVSYLTEELVKQGHDVTLFASADSKTCARLISPVGQSLRLSNQVADGSSAHLIMVDHLMQMQDEFDVIHFHIEGHQYPLLKYLKTPNMTTLHGRLDQKWQSKVLGHFDDVKLTSISNYQRRPLGQVNWHGNVYHGLPESLLKPHYDKENYLAFLGRISPEKGIEYAIEIASRANIPLKIAAKVDSADLQYFNLRVKPLLNRADIEFVGEIDDKGKQEFLGKAKALIFPIQWPEPFGLVMIEAMACDTPVIAFKNGSVPEIIKPGINGLIVQNVHDAIGAIEMLSIFKKGQCREYFEKHFLVQNMAKNYLELYRKLIYQKYSMPLKEGSDGFKEQSQLFTETNFGSFANTWQ